ncbi:MAG TPA: GDP-mannose 4,6-dehydratase [Nitrospinota bacterium]|nr:GDP-mannose 4,6-dehydratase [Nitrospinota bacterium]
MVTGAGGVIGSHLVEGLLREGARVRGLVRYNSRGGAGFLSESAAEFTDHLEIIHGDLNVEETVRKAVRGTEVVFHLAALIGIPYSYVHPAEVVRTNVVGTLNVLLATRDEGIQRVVHTSTSEVYGSAVSVPIAESHPLQPQSPYSASKIGADAVALSFQNAFDLPVAVIRPFNVYGPRQSARAVIPAVIVQALTRDVVRIGATHPTRDLTFVGDTVRGFMAMGEVPGAIGQTVNVGSGFEISIGELAEKIIERVGRPVRLETDASRLRPAKSEVTRLWAYNKKAKDLLGWAPEVSLDEGLDRTIAYIKDHLDDYDPDRYAV